MNDLDDTAMTEDSSTGRTRLVLPPTASQLLELYQRIQRMPDPDRDLGNLPIGPRQARPAIDDTELVLDPPTEETVDVQRRNELRLGALELNYIRNQLRILNNEFQETIRHLGLLSGEIPERLLQRRNELIQHRNELAEEINRFRRTGRDIVDQDREFYQSLTERQVSDWLNRVQGYSEEELPTVTDPADNQPTSDFTFPSIL